jgi:SWI/SNF-related matrix-associated actin-dependent regulator 1 of chromatin subfamily A
MSWVRYADDYGPRVALSFPYNNEAKDALKGELGFPAVKWDGEKKAWSIRDKPDELSRALEILEQFGYYFDGLETQSHATFSEVIVTSRPPDKLSMKWPYKPNYADINAAVKSCGTARFDKKTKEWVIPIAAGAVVAKAVKPHYPALSDALLAMPEVVEAHQHTAERVLLSSAVDGEPIWVHGLKNEESVRPYQWVAPNMFVTGGQNRLLLGDEMGLGKSLQALLCVLAGQYKKTLIVCPAVVKKNWSNEVEKWTNLTPSIIQGRSGDYETEDVTIINYDLLQYRIESLCNDGYECIIFDECHNMKSQKAKRSKAAMELVRWPTVEGIICMSGTPILNRPEEIFTTLTMLKPSTFPDYFLFGKKYCAAIHNGYGWDFGGASNIEESEDGTTVPLNHLLKDIMLRRTMDDPRLNEQMPDLVETILEIDVDRKQYDESYNTLMDQLEYYRTTGSGSIPPGLLLNILTELRHSAGKAKVEAASKWALDYMKTGKPLVIFAHHKDVVDELSNWLKLATITNNGRSLVANITGSTPDNERQRIIEEFQAGKIAFLVCSTLAMKEGVNLDAADTTLFVERQWVPAHEKQAAARVRRMTQESGVCHKVVLSASNTVDTHFDKIVSEKAALVTSALDGSENDKMIVAKSLADSLLSGEVYL